MFSLLICGAFFLLLEGALGVAGVPTLLERRDPYLGFAGSTPLFVPDDDASGGEQLRTAPNKRRWFNDQRFAARKPGGTRRIFCLGGSTTYGRPYRDATSFCGWLRVLLEEALPGQRFEVVNAGGISYASYRVAAVAAELAAYEPDLFVVYTGHNEFLEERTYGALRDRNAVLRRIDLGARRTRTAGLLHGAATRLGIAPGADEQLAGEVATRLDQSLGPDAYHRDDALRSRIEAHFRLNLERIVRVSRSAGAELSWVVPAANLRGCSPFRAEPDGSLLSGDVQRVDAALEAGDAAQRRGDLRAARDSYARAASLDARRADAHFALGRSRFALGDFAGAEQSLARALEEDVCPLRATAALQDAVREVAARESQPIVDLPALLRRESLRLHGHPVPGDEFFLDHVHPTVAGHGLIAEAVAAGLEASGWLPEGSSGSAGAVARARIEASIDPVDHAVALRNLAKVLAWAGKSREAAVLAERALAAMPDDVESLFILARRAAAEGDPETAVRRYERVLALEPDHLEARTNLGVNLVRLGRLDEAAARFRAVLEVDAANANARYNLANVTLKQRRYPEAIALYQSLLALDPDDADVHHNLARAFERSGRPARAAEHDRIVERLEGERDAPAR